MLFIDYIIQLDITERSIVLILLLLAVIMLAAFELMRVLLEDGKHD